MCAVGWEPNPKHVEYLQKMREAYKSCGYRVLINTRVGVGAHNTRTEVNYKLKLKLSQVTIFSLWRPTLTELGIGELMSGMERLLLIK